MNTRQFKKWWKIVIVILQTISLVSRVYSFLLFAPSSLSLFLRCPRCPRVEIFYRRTKASLPDIDSSSVNATNTGMHLPYSSTIEVLRKYHSIHGNLVIPRRYRVPCTSDFPSEWHDLSLSNIVYNMKWWSENVASKPERVYELNQLGFVWERLQPEYNLVLEALITYKAIYSDLKVPASFVVPDEDGEDRYQWPKATWGIPLGNCVYRIRARGDFLRDDETAWKRRRQLDNLGFIWDVNEYAFRKFLTAVKYYQKLEGGGFNSNRARIKVKSTFVVPSGKWLDNVDQNDSKMQGDYHQKLRNPWPEELHGYPLGAKCSAIRQKGLYIKDRPDRQKALIEIGLHFSGNAALGWLEVVHASAIYSKMHNRILDVPVNFVVPSPPSTISGEKECYSQKEVDEWPWPKNLWGLPLGQRLKDVRLKGAYMHDSETAVSRKAQLDALGFVWKPKRGRRR